LGRHESALQRCSASKNPIWTMLAPDQSFCRFQSASRHVELWISIADARIDYSVQQKSVEQVTQGRSAIRRLLILEEKRNRIGRHRRRRNDASQPYRFGSRSVPRRPFPFSFAELC